MADEKLKMLPNNRPIRLYNDTCPYCGRQLSKTNRNKEHVVGRRFVPRGKLDAQWNLIVWACSECNGFKGALEDEISAMTMQPDAHGKYAVPDKVLISESDRKASGSISGITGRPIKESPGMVTIRGDYKPGVTVSATWVSPPQIDHNRLYQLACMHCMAFFYLITYDASQKIGHFWLGEFYPLLVVPRSDWGNECIVGFAEIVRHWKTKVIGNAARGFFQIVIKKHPSANCWSWALEWNTNYRIFGLFGENPPVDSVVESLPALEFKEISSNAHDRVRMRAERPIADKDDHLFECVEDLSEDSK